MKILITGASGFIGSFLVEEALRQNYEVWAAVRASSSKAYLTDPRIHFISLDFSSPQHLQKQLEGHSFDYVVHAAGLTKSADPKLFYKVNTEGTIHLVEAIRALKMPLKRFVFISSLSIFGPIREQAPYTEITENDVPQPNTHYGKSKRMAESYLEELRQNDLRNGEDENEGFPYVILRPTGVYGPREHDYFLMAQSISNHVDVAAGFRRQDLTFIYVQDVVQAVFLALNHGKSGRAYFLSDGGVYSSVTFSKLIHRALGKPWLLRFTLPLWLLRLITLGGEVVGRVTGKVTALNTDKYHIMKQRNWRCNIEPALDELGFKPQYNLEKGVQLTMDWYLKNGWLR